MSSDDHTLPSGVGDDIGERRGGEGLTTGPNGTSISS